MIGTDCVCGATIYADDADAMPEAIRAHGTTDRHRAFMDGAYPEPVEVYVVPSPAPAAVRTILGPTPCIDCHEPVRVQRYPGGAIFSVHPSGSLACRPPAVASS